MQDKIEEILNRMCIPKISEDGKTLTVVERMEYLESTYNTISIVGSSPNWDKKKSKKLQEHYDRLNKTMQKYEVKKS